MPSNPEVHSRGKEPFSLLREADPARIHRAIFEKFDRQVRVKFAHHGELVTVPEGWHGAGLEGEVLVHQGDLLTAPLAGTVLDAKTFLDWVVEERFQLVDARSSSMSVAEAVKLVESNQMPSDQPLLRLTRTEGIPVEVQFWAGAASYPMETLARIGNLPTWTLTAEQTGEYHAAVFQLLSPFISKGTKPVREGLELPPHMDILRRVDDCAASLGTIIADQTVDDAMQISQENLLEVVDVAVGTTQAVVVAIAMARRRHVPLVMRIGAPVFGLSGGDNPNDIVTTLPEFKQYGPLAVGNMGAIMGKDLQRQKPELHAVRQDEPSRELRLFLGGGGPIEAILKAVHRARGKPIGWDIAVRSATRVHGPGESGVIMSGTSLTSRWARRDKSYFPPDTELVDHDGTSFYVTGRGLWASVGTPKGGLIPVSFIEESHAYTLYLAAKATQAIIL